MSVEEIALHVAHALRDVGQVLYAGPMVAFTLILVGHRIVPYVRTEDVVRVYRTWGPGFGFSLGAWVFGLLGTRYLDQGEFTWPFGTTAEILDSVGWILFFLMWANNCRLEVWTMDPVRKADKDGEGIVDRGRFDAAVANMRTVLLTQCILLVGAVSLWTIGAALA